MEVGSRFRERAMLCAVLVASMAAVTVALAGLSRSDAIERAMREIHLAAFQRGEMLFMNRGNFSEFEDRLLLEVLPAADYSRGGAYFIGSSNLKWALKLWELPPELRPLIHNYGIGASNHRHHFDFVRFLVEEEGLLEAGGENTLIVLGISYRSAALRRSAYFEALWGRHGLYEYDERGLRRADLSPLERRIRLERGRIASFVGVTLNRCGRWIALGLGIPLSASFQLTDRAGVERVAELYDVADPEERIAENVGQLEALVAYLRERRVAVALVLMPERETVHQRSIPRAYRSAVERIAASWDVPLLDLTRLLADDEFIDYNHANARGLDELHPILVELAARHVEGLRASTRP